MTLTQCPPIVNGLFVYVVIYIDMAFYDECQVFFWLVCVFRLHLACICSSPAPLPFPLLSKRKGQGGGKAGGSRGGKQLSSMVET